MATSGSLGTITVSLNGAAQKIATMPYPQAGITRWTIPWTSDASAGTVIQPLGLTIVGFVVAAEFVPGTPTPTTGYGVTLIDSNGGDVLTGQASSISSSAVVTKALDPNNRFPTMDNLTLNITSAGNSKQGTVVLFTRWPS